MLKENSYLTDAYETCVSHYNEALTYGVKVQTLLLKLRTIQRKDYRATDELKSDLIDIEEDAVQIHKYIMCLEERYGETAGMMKPFVENDNII